MTDNNTQNRTVLDVKDLRVYYETPRGDVKAVDGISFTLREGEILGLVGESGCGKSTAAMGVLQLISPPGRIVSGEINLDGTDLLGLTTEQLRQMRWSRLALIPQGAMNSLNPTMKIHQQIADVIRQHEKAAMVNLASKNGGNSNGKPAARMSRAELKTRILELLQWVGLPERIYSMYPHELSGGMKQRACIAMAIALNPSVIIADESTSALDVVVQRVVAQTMLKVKLELGVSMIMIGHDMGLMAQMADRIVVMYAGNIVEIATVEHMFKNPGHPYTQLLIESVPSLKERKPLKITEGITHDPRNPPPGCIFQLRCPFVMDRCRAEEPLRQEIRPGQEVACHLYEEQADGSYVDVRDIVEHS